MKSLITFCILTFATTFAQAEVILTCRLGEKDLVGATITLTNGVLTLTETNTKGEMSSKEITQTEWNNQWIRLSDSPMGFRYLAHMYSDIFNEFDWFVETHGGLQYSISRADCE